jgi:hypothetical protein
VNNLLNNLLEQDFDNTFEPASEEELKQRGLVKTKFWLTAKIEFETYASVDPDVEDATINSVGDVIGGILSIKSVTNVDIEDVERA